jgi:hypothetical protein
MSPRRRGVDDTGEQASLLDLVDNLLNRGVVLDGEVTLGVANVDLVYLRLSAVFSATDRLFPRGRSASGRRAFKTPRQ